MKYVIFTDLDGTLLDGADYSFDAARPALDLIAGMEVPLVFVTSKTRVEVEEIRRRVGNGDPFISENGGGVFVPDRYFPFDVGGEARGGEARGGDEAGGLHLITLGASYEAVRGVFEKVREEVRGESREAAAAMRGFGDMGAEEVAALTGLSLEEAKRAKERDFDEPFVMEADGEEGAEVLHAAKVLRAIEDSGLRWTRGGRFYHIHGDHDKGAAVEILKGFFKTRYGNITTIGLGDAANDADLLRAVDRPVLVEKVGGGYEEMDVPGLVRVPGEGPVGWNKAVTRILESIPGR